MRTLVTFRTHKIDEIDIKTVKTYITQLTDFCDISVNLNVRDLSQESTMCIKFWVSFCSSENIDLTVFCDLDIKEKFPSYKGAWLHSQFSFISTYIDLPNYDMYWFIEYDVRFNGIIHDLIIESEVIEADVLGTHVQTYSESKEWSWWTEQDIQLPVPLNQRYKYFGPISRFSSRLLDKLKDCSSKWYSNLESFIPTISVLYFGPQSVANINEKFWSPETFRYLPRIGNDEFYFKNIVPVTDYYQKLFHPVK